MVKPEKNSREETAVNACLDSLPPNQTAQRPLLHVNGSSGMGCVQDNESITHHTESRERGRPISVQLSDNRIRTCVYPSRLLHHKKTLSPSHATVCNTYQAISPIQNRACLEQQQQLSALAILRVLEPHCR